MSLNDVSQEMEGRYRVEKNVQFTDCSDKVTDQVSVSTDKAYENE